MTLANSPDEQEAEQNSLVWPKVRLFETNNEDDVYMKSLIRRSSLRSSRCLSRRVRRTMIIAGTIKVIRNKSVPNETLSKQTIICWFVHTGNGCLTVERTSSAVALKSTSLSSRTKISKNNGEEPDQIGWGWISRRLPCEWTRSRKQLTRRKWRVHGVVHIGRGWYSWHVV